MFDAKPCDFDYVTKSLQIHVMGSFVTLAKFEFHGLRDRLARANAWLVNERQVASSRLISAVWYLRIPCNNEEWLPLVPKCVSGPDTVGHELIYSSQKAL